MTIWKPCVFARVVAMAFLVAVPSAPARATSILVARAEEALEANFLVHESTDVALQFVREERDREGFSHIRFQQTFAGIPVFEGQVIVHYLPNERLWKYSDNLFRGIRLNPEPELTSGEALWQAMAEEDREDGYSRPANMDLWIVAAQDGPRLAWRVELFFDDQQHDPSMPIYFIDAHTSELVFHYDNLQGVNATGTGTSLYGGTVPLQTWQASAGATYYLQDIDYRKYGTYDATGESNDFESNCRAYSDVDNVWSSSVQNAAVDVHMGTQQAIDYYKYDRGRNGIDGKGGPTYCSGADATTKVVTSRVHYGNRYNNAFWNGKFMTYGDGDGSTFGPLVSLDVVGHELTHGVTQFSANLTYSGESGALNESISDVFGTMIEFFTYGNSADWKIGEDCYTPTKAGDALRHMDRPHNASNKGYTSDDDPDHYSERYTGTGDYGGVHINSGIPNNAFYLLAMGGTHHKNPGVTLTGIGKSKAAKIWYTALTSYMNSCTNFAKARTNTLDAASQLYGATSPEYQAVAKVWDTVGVSAGQSQCTSAAPSSPVIWTLGR